MELGDIVNRWHDFGQHNGVVITPSVNVAVWHQFLVDPLYVVDLDVDKKHVIVGPKELLKTRIVPVVEVNWLGDEPMTSRKEWYLASRSVQPAPTRGDFTPHQ